MLKIILVQHLFSSFSYFIHLIKISTLIFDKNISNHLFIVLSQRITCTVFDQQSQRYILKI